MEFDIVTVISQVGFPIAVATYSMVVLNKTIRENTKVVQALAVKLGVYENGSN